MFLFVCLFVIVDFFEKKERKEVVIIIKGGWLCLDRIFPLKSREEYDYNRGRLHLYGLLQFAMKIRKSRSSACGLSQDPDASVAVCELHILWSSSALTNLELSVEKVQKYRNKWLNSWEPNLERSALEDTVKSNPQAIGSRSTCYHPLSQALWWVS